MFFKDNKNDEVLIKVAALLIHAAKIDENYSKKEKEIIKKTLLKIDSTNEKIEEIMSHANDINENSNHILDFTKEVKKMSNAYKIKIIEALWRIIYSDNDADIYETSLMRRLAGLLYIDNKTMADIKNKIKNENL
tara:strand:- start:116 stop:520 length:405 start_codon:yes stop_codon:yes gene_type:complete